MKFDLSKIALQSIITMQSLSLGHNSLDTVYKYVLAR